MSLQRSISELQDLGYDANRSADLSRIEIVKMIKEYKDFKFPVIFGSEKK